VGNFFLFQKEKKNQRMEGILWIFFKGGRDRKENADGGKQKNVYLQPTIGID